MQLMSVLWREIGRVKIVKMFWNLRQEEKETMNRDWSKLEMRVSQNNRTYNRLSGNILYQPSIERMESTSKRVFPFATTPCPQNKDA